MNKRKVTEQLLANLLSARARFTARRTSANCQRAIAAYGTLRQHLGTKACDALLKEKS